jgi:hypothetical protein
VRTVDGAIPMRRAVRYATNELQPNHFAHVAHARSLCWHPVSPSESRRSRPKSASRGAPTPRRDHPGMVGDIISESWATSSRNRGRDHPGIAGAFLPESAVVGLMAKIPAGFRFATIDRTRWCSSTNVPGDLAVAKMAFLRVAPLLAL